MKALDKATNKEQSIKIEASSGLSKEDIEKMQKDAEINEAADKQKREIIDAKNLAEQMIYTAEKAIKDNGDKVSEDIKKGVEEKITALKTAQASDNLDEIKKKSEELSTEMQKIGEELSKQATQNTEAPKQDDGVKEAEVENNDSTPESGENK